MMLKQGDKAPNFTLWASDKSEISLADFRGKPVVIVFFPLAFTGVCTEELCSIRDEKADYNSLNVEVLAISVDTVPSLAKFKEEQSYNFPLLSDFNKEVSMAYGSFYDDFVFGMKGVSKRSAFVIDKDGIVRYAEVLESAKDIPNFKAIKETIAGLK
ncbi:MAG: peroxiredoxin [Muriicola sp.]|nr:peroxiredoxin [Muriicola sp.]